jgi:dihydroorotase
MKTHPLALINGQYIDFRQGSQDSTNLLLQNGQVIGHGYMPDDGVDRQTLVYDIKGCIIVPGIIDTSVHIREPGEEDKETVASVSAAAIAGGITGIVSSPDTTPSPDNPEMIAALLRKGTQVGQTPIYPIGCLSKGRSGQNLAEMGLMRDAGALAFSDLNSIQDSGLMEQAMRYAKALDCPVIVSPDEPTLHRGGVMNSSASAIQKGLKGIPAHAEELRLSRDIQLAACTGVHLHVFPVSTAGAVAMIRDAKAKKIHVTCGTAPHYLYFSDSDIGDYDTQYKVMPPFRSKADQEALLEGIKDGTIDCIASHHHPMTVDEKRTDFISAGFGISGIDTFVPAVIHKLVHDCELSIVEACRLISQKPREIFKLPKMTAGLLKRPSFTVIHPKKETHVSADTFISRGKNSPFIGKTFQSRVMMTVIDGHIVYQDPELTAVPASEVSLENTGYPTAEAPPHV